MPNYISDLKKAESKRYIGFSKYLKCVNNSQITKDYKNIVDTIKKIKDAIEELIIKKQQEKFESILQEIIEPEGEIREEYEEYLIEKIEEAVKKKKRILSDNEIEELVIELAKEVEISENKPPKKCIEDEFNLEDFTVNYDPPIITPQIVSNLQQLHSEIIVPIMKYYKEEIEDFQNNTECKFVVVCGVASKLDMIRYNFANVENVHPRGKAVDFYIKGLSSERVFKDICNNVIDLNYGVVFNKGMSIHITIPYNRFNRFILSTNNNRTPFTTAVSFDGKVMGELFN